MRLSTKKIFALLIMAFALQFATAEEPQSVQLPESGEAYIEQGKVLIKAGKAKDAYELFVKGVELSPDNLEGRMILAQFAVLMGKQQEALNILEAKLALAAKNIEYIRAYTRLVLNVVEDEKFIKISKTFIDNPDASKEVKEYLSMAVATVHALHGNYGESKEYIIKSGLDKTTAGILRLSKNEWEMGNRAGAVDFIAKNISYMKDLDPVYGLLVNYYITMQDFNKARQYASLRMLEKPTEMAPHIDYIRVLFKSGDIENTKKELEKLIDQNGDSNKSMLYIANCVSEIGDVSLMKKVYDKALEKKFPIAPYGLLMIETLINIKDYKSAATMSDQLMIENPAAINQYKNVFMLLKAQIFVGEGNLEAAGIIIDEITKKENIQPKTMISTARKLDAMGELGLAHKLLLCAVKNNPKHQLALTRLVELEIRMGDTKNVCDHTMQILKMRRPSKELIEKIKTYLEADKSPKSPEKDKALDAINEILAKDKEQQSSRILSDTPLNPEESILNPTL